MAFEQLPIDPEVEALVRLLVVAEMHVQQALNEALSSGALGTAAYRRRRLMMLKAQLERVLTQINRQAPTVLRNAFIVGLHVAGGRSLVSTFGTAGSERAVSHLVQNMLSSLESGVMTLGRNTEDVFRRVGLRQSALHLLESTPYKTAAKAMEKQLLREGQTSFVDRAGRHWTLGNYSKMVIRTTTREAVSLGTKQGLIANGRDLVQVSEHVGACDRCSPYAGKTFSLSGRIPGYPVLAHTPPYHPNCRCVIAPAAASFEALEAEFGLAPSVGMLVA